MNMYFFRLINNLAYKNGLLDQIMIFFSKYVPYLFMAMIIAVFIAGVVNKSSEYRKIAVSTIAVSALNLVIAGILASIFYVNRPFVHNKVNLLFSHVQDASFPSDHATGTMGIALGLGRYSKILSKVLTILSVIVGISRVYVGHHYPLDVIGGFALAYGTSYLYNTKVISVVNKLYNKVENKFVGILKIGKAH